jgi:hypothetical protein
MIQLSSSSDDLRERARNLIASHGEVAVTLAEWESLALEEAGRLEEARQWRMVAGTIMAMIET